MFVNFSKPTNLLFVAAVVLAVAGAFGEGALLSITHLLVGLLVVLGLAFGWRSMRHTAAEGMIGVMMAFVVLSILLPPGIGSAVGAAGFGVEGAKVLSSGDVLPFVSVRLILRYLADFFAPAIVMMGFRYLNLKSRQ